MICAMPSHCVPKVTRNLTTSAEDPRFLIIREADNGSRLLKTGQGAWRPIEADFEPVPDDGVVITAGLAEFLNAGFPVTLCDYDTAPGVFDHHLRVRMVDGTPAHPIFDIDLIRKADPVDIERMNVAAALMGAAQ